MVEDHTGAVLEQEGGVLHPAVDDEPPGPPGPIPTGAPPQSTFVFAIGRVEPRFPSLGIEKEFAQATGQANVSGRTDREALHSVLTDRSNRYLVRQICWLFTVEGLETYVLVPREAADFELLTAALRAEPSPTDVDVLIGERAALAPPGLCGGITVPVVVFDQLYSFDRAALVDAIPRPESVSEADEGRFRTAAGELFDRLMQIADNAGATDEHRALNYLAVRYPAIYARANEAYENNFSLAGVQVRPSRLSGARQIVDVIFSFTHRQTDVTEHSFARVDVTEEFPFLVTKLGPYYPR